MIDKPTHIVNNSMSWIDFLFCSNENAISNFWVGVSVFDKCHYNIRFGEINIGVLLFPVYVCQVCNYSQETGKYQESNT